MTAIGSPRAATRLMLAALVAVAAGAAGSAPSPSGADAELAALAARLDDLAHRTALLRDRQAIENLQRAYGYYLDHKMWDQIADLFADGATYEDGHSGVFVGKRRLRAYLASLGPDGGSAGELFNHIQVTPIVDVAPDGRSAKGRWHMIGQLGTFGRSAAWTGGVYENDYVKEGGVWKIKALHLYTTFVAPYDQGWGKATLPDVPLNAPRPDRPPSVGYRAYPGYFVPPFHFPNPATGRPAKITMAPSS